MKYKISELIMNGEKPYYDESKELKNYKAVRKVVGEKKTRYLTWVDDKHMTSIATPEKRELTPEELFDFVIGENITDLARSKTEERADIAIVLGSGNFKETKARAIKAFELYKLGIVKKIIFTGGVAKSRDVKGIMHPKTLEDYKNEKLPEFEWQDLPEADWGAETFVPDIFEENYQKHQEKLTEKYLLSVGVKPEDVLTESLSSTTQENAEFCRDIFDILETEIGMKVKTAVIVTTCTHGHRAMEQFKKVFGDKIDFKWCPATLDLEKYETLRSILRAPEFDEEEFRKEIKRIYCTTPELIQKLMEETANHRNAFIFGDIDEQTIETANQEKEKISNIEIFEEDIEL